MDGSAKLSPRHSPIISPLQSRSPFFLPPRRESSSRSRHSTSLLSRTASSFLPSRCTRLLPRSKARFVLLVVVLSTVAIGVLVSFSVLSLDLPPIDEYDHPNKHLVKAEISRSFEGEALETLSSTLPTQSGPGSPSERIHAMAKGPNRQCGGICTLTDPSLPCVCLPFAVPLPDGLCQFFRPLACSLSSGSMA